ncbi:MAG TPA: TIM barrel protein [Steroidobacteraceae bacterium]|nr:TIM barrel protein [Steroidobacteraceae bacterium]
MRAIVLKFCANISWLFTELPFLARADASRRAGFTAIEFHSTQGCSPSEIVATARDAGVSIALFNASPGDFLNGGAGLSGVPGRERQFAEILERACDLGASIGGAYVQIGQSRVPAGVQRAECLRVFVQNLRLAARVLGKVGCRPLVEPMNTTDAPGVLIRNACEAIAAIDAAADPRIGLQLDCYHEHTAGSDVRAAIERWGARIAHLQFSDAPGRHEPGSGAIEFASIWAQLAQMKFDRWIAAEYQPSGLTGDSLAWLSNLKRARDTDA